MFLPGPGKLFTEPLEYEVAKVPVLHFDGADDWVRGTGMGAMNGAVTIACLIRRNGALPTYGAYLGGATSASARSFMFAVDNAGTQATLFDATSNSNSTSTIVFDDRDWYVVAYTKAAGTVTPRFHFKNVSKATAAVHENGSTTNVNFPSVLGGYLKIGNYDLTPGTPGSAEEDFLGDIGLVAWWDGTALSDAQIDELYVNKQTTDWQNNTAGQPSSITQLQSTTPTDLKSLVTWVNTGTSVIQDPVAGWNFNGTVATTITVNMSGVLATATGVANVPTKLTAKVFPVPSIAAGFANVPAKVLARVTPPPSIAAGVANVPAKLLVKLNNIVAGIARGVANVPAKLIARVTETVPTGTAIATGNAIVENKIIVRVFPVPAIANGVAIPPLAGSHTEVGVPAIANASGLTPTISARVTGVKSSALGVSIVETKIIARVLAPTAIANASGLRPFDPTQSTAVYGIQKRPRHSKQDRETSLP